MASVLFNPINSSCQKQFYGEKLNGLLVINLLTKLWK